jgi:hypothetical protein
MDVGTCGRGLLASYSASTGTFREKLALAAIKLT